MWLIINCFPYENAIEEFDSYEEAKERFDKLNENIIDGQTIYLSEVKLYREQYRGKFK